MKLNKLILIALIAVSMVECKSKKSVATTAPTPVTSNTPTTPTNTTTPTTGFSTFSTPKSTEGVPAPEDKELAAIQAQYSDVTLEKLQIGHMLYTVGACINCHGAKNIYKRETSQWKGIIDNMAEMAKLNEAQKDAVFKYVLSVKVTQPK
ncbi:MAG: hypothetical protein H0W73_09400 [Bacteroidetes bacterium]|nr:hypothetical protein [Bacteroidota bacterium]